MAVQTKKTITKSSSTKNTTPDIQFILNTDNATKPERSTEGSAGYDFYASENILIKPNEFGVVPTDVRIHFPKTIGLLLLNRSSTPRKKKLLLTNGIGLIDSDYEQTGIDVKFEYWNISNRTVRVDKGERVGQGVFLKIYHARDENPGGTREGGHGSTG